MARSSRNNRSLSLLMIDVDKFKAINELADAPVEDPRHDTFGHPVGDRVLATIGAVLRANTCSYDRAGRLGGDEFAVLAPDTDVPEAVALGDRIRGDLARAVDVPVTLSVGVSGLRLSSPTTEQMVSDADLALYDVKRAGGDGVAVF